MVAEKMCFEGGTENRMLFPGVRGVQKNRELGGSLPLIANTLLVDALDEPDVLLSTVLRGLLWILLPTAV